MSGFLRRFFAPRWQHRDPSVRRQAAERLDPTDNDDRQRLERLATDSDPGVRQTALASLDDPARLLTLRDTHDSPELHRRLLGLLSGRDGSTPLTTRIELVARIEEPTLLETLALEGDNQALRLAALARLDDESRLLRQACDNGIAAVRHAAAERVTSEAGLTQLARRARRDKQVARQARARLNRLRENETQARETRERREHVLDSLEAHARHAWEPLYSGRYRHLQREWESLDDLPTPEQERRFQEAALRCRKVIADHEAHHHALAAADQRRDDADETRRSLIEALEDTLAGLRHGERLTEQDIASLQAQKRLLDNQWQTLSDRHPPETALSERYARALSEYERINQAWGRLERHVGALEEALAEPRKATLRQCLDALDWPHDLPPSPLLAQARQRLADAPDEPAGSPEQAARVARDLEELESLLGQGAFKRASRLHQSLRQRLGQLAEADRRQYQPTLKRLGAQLAELRDWRGFVAGPKRVQLCQAIEALAEDTTLADVELDRQHRQLVKDWKNLGDAAADRELSARFRAASERIHERLVPWREKRDALREDNLAAREALCEQLEALLANPDPDADPDALRQIRDRAREQWRRFAPVPRDRAQAIGQRFGEIRHALQMLIDRRAQEIAGAKRELVEKARVLQADTTTSAAQRAERAKTLQRQWRELGRAPKGEEQALWREFRGLCDTLFAARENERDDRAQRTRERLDAMQALIERIDAWQPDASDDVATLEAAIAEAESLEPLPQGRRSDGMRRRWTGIVRARRERLARLAVSEEIQRWQALRPLLEAHLTADARACQGSTAESVPLPSSPLDDDMQEAHEQRNAARRAPPPDDVVDERLTRRRVHLALLAGGTVRREDEPLRLAIQVQRLNDGLGRELTRADELHDVLRDILATGPVAPALWEREAAELDRQLSRLAELPPP
ncbi:MULTISPECIES: DUF349 domain-containing protein [unclassified Modicisalibacter]|uniref:DUF349 domain-containing protein n=1 Tax=unclassified Modicisalibacter TaxID=2679913 RepID=UPI001CCD71FF|nr:MULTISPECIES: DUF349 domain-containing protein [unclassified Modicisalibacter]MBZ9558223.1 DUF349 domain-containing protein [Modicisalibacter sp. R2A 31.J]MBZ9573109.1 DUF349 domain-containing protein [Modicisalibacter sp. MOD 31.J]